MKFYKSLGNSYGIIYEKTTKRSRPGGRALIQVETGVFSLKDSKNELHWLGISNTWEPRSPGCPLRTGSAGFRISTV